MFQLYRTAAQRMRLQFAKVALKRRLTANHKENKKIIRKAVWQFSARKDFGSAESLCKYAKTLSKHIDVVAVDDCIKFLKKSEGIYKKSLEEQHCSPNIIPADLVPVNPSIAAFLETELSFGKVSKKLLKKLGFRFKIMKTSSSRLDASRNGPCVFDLSSRLQRQNKHSLVTATDLYFVNCEVVNAFPFSLKGYFLPSILPVHHPINYSHHINYEKPEHEYNDLVYVMPPMSRKGYYHNLCDFLPGLFWYKELGLNCPIIVFCEGLANELVYKFAKLLDITPEKIVSREFTDHRKFKVGIICRGGFLDSSSFLVDFYRNIGSNVLDKSKSLDLTTITTSSRKTYISRKHSLRRQLVNEAEIERYLEESGWSICYMEDYSFEEQVELMHHSSMIMSPHGAGLTNILFCPEKSVVIELTYREMYVSRPIYRKLASACGHRYFPVMGTLVDEASRSWHLEIDSLKALFLNMESDTD